MDSKHAQFVITIPKRVLFVLCVLLHNCKQPSIILFSCETKQLKGSPPPLLQATPVHLACIFFPIFTKVSFSHLNNRSAISTVTIVTYQQGGKLITNGFTSYHLPAVRQCRVMRTGILWSPAQTTGVSLPYSPAGDRSQHHSVTGQRSKVTGHRSKVTAEAAETGDRIRYRQGRRHEILIGGSDS